MAAGHLHQCDTSSGISASHSCSMFHAFPTADAQHAWEGRLAVPSFLQPQLSLPHGNCTTSHSGGRASHSAAPHRISPLPLLPLPPASENVTESDMAVFPSGTSLKRERGAAYGATSKGAAPPTTCEVEAACPSDVGLVLDPCQQALELFLQQHHQQEHRSLSELSAAVAAAQKSFDGELWAARVEAIRHKRRAAELEGHLGTLTESALLLQSRLQTSHSVAAALQAKLQQVLAHNQQLSAQVQQMQRQVALSLERSREGSGESAAAGPAGADSAESAYTETLESAHARAQRECEELREQRACRGCRTADVAVLLLPCRHLCLCKACEGSVQVCPLCSAPKQASLLVHMS